MTRIRWAYRQNLNYVHEQIRQNWEEHSVKTNTGTRPCDIVVCFLVCSPEKHDRGLRIDEFLCDYTIRGIFKVCRHSYHQSPAKGRTSKKVTTSFCKHLARNPPSSAAERALAMLRLYICWGSIVFYLSAWQRCAYGVEKFRCKNHVARIQRR